MKYLPAIRRWFEGYASVDLRALALTRILLAGIILFDLFYRAHHLYEHYGRFGIFPKELWLTWWAHSGYWSLHMLFEAPEWSLALMALEAVCAFFMLVGWHTRLSTALVWFLAVSLDHANQFIIQSGDIWLTVFLFLGIFLPLGKYASVDAGLDKNPTPSPRFASIWTFAFILQIALFYFAASLFKNGITWQDGNAVYYALSLDYFRTWFGSIIYQSRPLLTLLTFGVHYLQYAVPYLILAPFFTKYVRTTAVILLIGMHTGLGLSMNLGPFSFVSIAGLCALLPSAFFDAMHNFLVQRGFGSLTIYYDEDCGFCRKSAHLIRTLLLVVGSRVVPAQTNPSVYADMKTHNSWVIVDATGNRFFTYKAGIRIIEASPLLFLTAPLFKLRASGFIGEKVYRFVANHRGSVCLLPKKGRNFPHLATTMKSGSILLGIVYIGAIVTANTAPFLKSEMLYNANQKITLPMGALGITQNWRMFSPNPPSEDGWIIARGVFSNGKIYDLFSYPHALSYEKPKNIAYAPYIRDERTRKYLGNVIGNSAAAVHIYYYAKSLCYQYREPNALFTDASLASLDIFAMKQITGLTHKNKPEKSLLFTLNCTDSKQK